MTDLIIPQAETFGTPALNLNALTAEVRAQAERDAAANGATADTEAAAEASTTRPEVFLDEPGMTLDWLRQEIGRGPLKGVFNRRGTIVFTAREGESGYVPLTDADGDNDGPAQVRPLGKTELASRIDHGYRVLRLDRRSGTYVHKLFPEEVAARAIAAPDLLPNTRPLHGVTHVPVVRPDGSVLDTPGYDTSTKLLYIPDAGLEVPPVKEKPSSADVEDAVAVISYMLQDFKFVTPHDRVNYIGMMLTPMLRTVAPPPYKLCIINAHMPGSGKSYLAAALRILHGGVIRSEFPVREEELQKQITSILLCTTAPVVQFDNVDVIVRSSTLSGLLTTAELDDRLLGASMMSPRLVNDRMWIITGNNVRVGRDIPRRALWSTIDPGVPNPELRPASDFAIRDFPGWVRSNRGAVLRALLTLVRAFYASGEQPEVATSDSYGRWVGLVRAIIDCAGFEGTFDEREIAKGGELGLDDQELHDFLEDVEMVFGDKPWTSMDVLEHIKEPLDEFGGNSTRVWIERVPEVIAERVRRSGRSSAKMVLSKWLSNRDGRFAGKLVVRKLAEKRKRDQLWRVERAG